MRITQTSKTVPTKARMDASTDALRQRPGVRIQDERATVVGDDADIPKRRAARSDDELERSGDTISLEEAREQLSEEELGTSAFSPAASW